MCVEMVERMGYVKCGLCDQRESLGELLAVRVSKMLDALLLDSRVNLA